MIQSGVIDCQLVQTLRGSIDCCHIYQHVTLYCLVQEGGAACWIDPWESHFIITIIIIIVVFIVKIVQIYLVPKIIKAVL